MSQSKSPALISRFTAIDLLVLAILWSLAVFIVNPVGNFPLNDDWAASRSVKHLVEDGVYQPTGWLAMTLIIHVFWGALFCLPFGFSFMAVRVSTLVLSLAGVLGAYGLIRQLERPRWLAMIFALTLCFNPIYFSLANTFMTDVPFTTWEILSCLFYVRFLQRQKPIDFWLATTLAVAGMLVRQLGLAIPIAFGAAFLFQNNFKRKSWFYGVLPAVVAVTTLTAFNHWLSASGKAARDYNLQLDQLAGKVKHPLTLPLNFAHYGWVMLMYIGFFLLPVFAAVRFNRQDAAEKSHNAFWAGLALSGLAILSAGHFLLKPSLMPVHLNILDAWGLGPLTLRDTQMMRLPDVPRIPAAFWLVVTGLSLFGAGLLVLMVVRQVRRIEFEYRLQKSPPPRATGGQAKNAISIFFLASTLIYLGPLLTNGFFDRYLLAAVVFAGAFVVAASPVQERRPGYARYAAGLLLIIGFAGYAVAGTRDYLEWNRVRWEALADLQKNHISPEQIDGGFEFNGWLFYDPKFHGPPHKSDWWVKDDEYLVSFGKLAGYETYREYRYAHWMPPYEGSILVLKRKDEASATELKHDSEPIK